MRFKEAGAFLNIDLGALVFNWEGMRRYISPSSRCGAVVKSDAYGLGAEKISSALYRAGCRDFFVAYLSEGIALRRVIGDSGRIFVLHGFFSGTEREFTRYKLIPVLNTIEQIEGWLLYTQKVGHRFPVALHFDTGMSRLSFSRQDQEFLFGEGQDKLKLLEVVLVMSHLANGDIQGDKKNEEQLNLFRDIRDKVSKILGYSPEYSLSATAGIFLGKEYLFDLCRPGLGLYGIYPYIGLEDKILLRPVVSLYAKIIQLQRAHIGQSVGYGSSYSFTREGIIATVCLGYADGFLRSLGNKGYGSICGKQVPVIGRISMDLTTFDVTEVPSKDLYIGQEVEIIGPHNTIDFLANSGGTIPYELFTNIGDRYYRRYKKEEKLFSVDRK